ncbi:MAG TPA: PaaI family thioesterase [Acidimicrobiales bacterium]|jgi:uncharacterized protein (TIGR00369 family)
MPAMTVGELQQFLLDGFPLDPPTFVVEDMGDDTIWVRLPILPSHGRPGGTVSGPALMSLADCTAWLAIVGHIGPVPSAVTTSLHIDFLRKPALVDVVAIGTVLKLGTRLAVVEVAMASDGGDEVIAKAQVTYSIPPDPGDERQ